jgi:excisionase family DNA binding protein
MQNEIILSGITSNELQENIRLIVRKEFEEIFGELKVFPEMEPTPEFITRKETCRILGITLPTLNEWTKNGVIPAQRIGSRIRYLRTDVYASLKQVEIRKCIRA